MTFARPEWLYALGGLIPALIILYWISERKAGQRLRRFAASKLIADLTRSYSRKGRITKMAFSVLAAALLCLALARPQYGFVLEETEARGIDVMIALDTSRSMLAEDVKPSRLERSKLAILDLVQQLQGDRVGLIAFAGDAFLQCPLTLDYDAFRQTLESIDTETIPFGGTDIAVAIEEALEDFGHEANFKLLVLITDGEDLGEEGVKMAETASADGMRIFTVGVGGSQGELIPITNERGVREYVRDGSGNLVRSSLDESTLRAIAAATNGAYLPLGAGGAGLHQIYQDILQLFPQQERHRRIQQIPLERFQWPLAGALLFLLLEPLVSTRRRDARIGRGGVASVVAIFGLLSLFVTNESRASAVEALRLYEKGEYAQASELYAAEVEKNPDDARIQYNYGNSLYREGRFAEARDAFTAALATDDPDLQADAFFNLGNALYRLGDTQEEDIEGQRASNKLWQEALDAYENALALSPDAPDVQRNSQVVSQARKNITYQLEILIDPEEAGNAGPSGNFVRNDTVELYAKPNEGWVFRGWNKAQVAEPDAASTSLDLKGDTILIAEFVKTWKLDVEVADAAQGSAEKSGVYPEDQPVVIKATAKDRYAFLRWEAEGCELAAPSAAEAEVQLTQDAKVTAHFVDAYYLEVKPSPALGPKKLTASGWYPVNQPAPIQAEVREGFEWKGWSGENIDNPTALESQVYLDKDRSVTAEFNRLWNLIVASQNEDQGTTEGSADEPVGSTVPISAQAQEGFVFDHWEGDGVADPTSANTFVTILSEEHDVIAVFVPEESDDQQDQSEQEQQQDQQQSDSSENSQSESQQDQSGQQQEQDSPQQQGDEEQESSSGDQSESEEEEASEQEQQSGEEEEPQGEEEQEAQAGEESEEEPSEEGENDATQRVMGQMTAEEAIQLLNSLRESEKKLPSVRRQRSGSQGGTRNDW